MEFSLKGRVYVTTLVNAKKYHKKELAELYVKRWLIELDFRSLKTHMKMEMLRCKSPDMVDKEIAVYFLAYNLIRASIARATKVKCQIPRLISFMTTVQIFNEGILRLIILSGKVLKYAIDGLLNAIASIPISQQKRKAQPRLSKHSIKSVNIYNIQCFETYVSIKKWYIVLIQLSSFSHLLNNQSLINI